MGAHTVGQFVQNSQMFKYWWSRGEHSYFNNDYYKTMTATKDYIIRSPDKARTITKSIMDHVIAKHLLWLGYFNQPRPDMVRWYTRPIECSFLNAVLMQTSFSSIRAPANAPVCTNQTGVWASSSHTLINELPFWISCMMSMGTVERATLMVTLLS